MKPRISMRAALSDNALLGAVLAGSSWQAWRILLIAAMGEALTAEERAIFKQFTGREAEPQQPVEEFVAHVPPRSWQPTLAGYASTRRWCAASAACCSALPPTNGRPTSLLTIPRPISAAARSSAS